MSCGAARCAVPSSCVTRTALSYSHILSRDHLLYEKHSPAARLGDDLRAPAFSPRRPSPAGSSPGKPMLAPPDSQMGQGRRSSRRLMASRMCFFILGQPRPRRDDLIYQKYRPSLAKVNTRRQSISSLPTPHSLSHEFPLPSPLSPVPSPQCPVPNPQSPVTSHL